jgi:hypothetical protein
LRNLRSKYYKSKNGNFGSMSAADQIFIMNGDGNGTLGYSPHPYSNEMVGTIGGGNTFAGRAYELTVGGDSQSSKGRFNPHMKKISVQPAPTSIFEQIEDNLHPYKYKQRN